MIKFNPPLDVAVKEKTIKVSELPLVIVDVQRIRVCRAQSSPFFKTLNLWEGDAYDAIGNYTQEQAEARFLELLGDNPAVELAKLYVEPQAK